MRLVRTALLLVSLALVWPCVASADDLHVNPVDQAGDATLTKLADGRWRVATSLFTLTVSDAKAQQWADVIDPPPAPPSDRDGDGFADASDLCPDQPGVAPDGCPPVVPPPATGAEGDVRPMRPLQSDMDSYVLGGVSGNTANRTWLDRFERFRVYMNGGGSGGWPADKAYAQGWLNQGWVYKDAMVATYRGTLIGDEHYLWDKPPGDSTRQRLYVNFSCSGGVCPQYAADLGNANTRKRYVDGATAQAKTAGGLFMDDANFWLERVVSNGSGQFVRPWNPRTGAPMTNDEWAGYMLQLVRDAKAALPDPLEVVINTVPFHGPGILNIPQAKAALGVVDGWELERGFGDTGISASAFDGTFKPAIDYAHSVGAFVVHDVQSTAAGRVYPEAAYLCLNAGHDFYGHPDMRPELAWDPLWDKNLGAATSACVKGSDGVYRRNFERGTVTVNPSTRTGSIG